MRYTITRTAAGALLGTALCGAGTVHAQSNVSVYGLLDLNVGASTHAASDGGTVERVGSGGMNTSRLGFKGSEDLGDGLKAVFQLEAAVLGDTGGTDAALFKRQANVGLEGRYGRIVFGRSFTTVYDFMIRYDPMGFAPFYSWGTSGGATGANKYGMTTGFDNMVKYAGKAGGLTGCFGLTLGHGALLVGAAHVALGTGQLGAGGLQLGAGLGIVLLQHLQELPRFHRVADLAVDVGGHLLQHADDGLQALFQAGLARRVGLGVDLALQMLGRGHALVRQRLDLVGFALLAVMDGAGFRHLPAQPVEMLLHGPQLRLGRGLRIPADQRLHGALDGLVGLDTHKVADEGKHG